MPEEWSGTLPVAICPARPSTPLAPLPLWGGGAMQTSSDLIAHPPGDSLTIFANDIHESFLAQVWEGLAG